MSPHSESSSSRSDSSGPGANMFPPLRPTPEQQAAYERTAQRLLDSTMQHYQVHTFHHRREMSRKRWKAVKSREYITVYKERDPQARAHDDVGEDWNDPKLLVAAGAIIGSLDDVMYGVVTPDAASMLLKASITKNRLIGGAVLHQIRGPTAQDPFRFLGIKWFVMAPPTTFNGMIWSRDLVFIEATGVRTLPNGDRVGYQLMQSVDIPGYGHLEEHSIMRGRISSCSVFKQLANGTVDVYVRGYVEAFGKVMDSVALKTAASGFLSSWNAVGCARYKKLMWCVMQRHSHAGYAGDAGVHGHRGACAGCSKRFGKFSSVGLCTLCKQWVCSRCRIVSKLRDVDSELSIEERDAIVCTACVAHVDARSTFEVAAQEIRSGRFTLKRAAKPTIKLWSFRRRRSSRTRASSASLVPSLESDGDIDIDSDDHGSSSSAGEAARPRPRTLGGVRLFDPTELYAEPRKKLRTHSSDSEPIDEAEAELEASRATGYDVDIDIDDLTDEDDEILALDTLRPRHDQQYQHLYHYQPTVHRPQQQRPVRPQAPEQLYQKMLDLQAATEQIYQLTLKNSDAHLERRAGTPTRR
ncbi:hypothetical protein PybrP1_010146 [[Pythium] brassicae (nom. inval.)]|nr:hypothetical protein PybrP1_010146 [[Pythium] brassicae (nom. inval.)]